ncbi:Uncharacterised protein [Actinobacillus pleuropneumoniae]|nr:Uncharacterised protein [Actinobacillus pleuropneumoniae]
MYACIPGEDIIRLKYFCNFNVIALLIFLTAGPWLCSYIMFVCDRHQTSYENKK